jgi:protein-tyrosine phosphatase
MSRPDPFEAVFVCTGNRFRSPLAEALFRRAAEGIPVAASSLGTLELGAVPALPEAFEQAARLGVDLAPHRARTIVDADLRGADLVVGFERMHVVTAVVDAHAPRARTFTLPELVELLGQIEPPLEGDPVARAREAIVRAQRARPPDDPALFAVAELADPLGRGPGFFRETADRLDELVGQLAARLFATDER